MMTVRRLKAEIKRIFSKKPVKPNAEEREKIKGRLAAKYPQMYKGGTLKGTETTVKGVRHADNSSVSAVNKMRDKQLKKKYRSK